MVSERLDVRLDKERKRKLEAITRHRGVSKSVAIRQAIDTLYEEDLRQRRIAAAEAIGRMEIEDLPEPEELSRQLSQAYDTSLP